LSLYVTIRLQAQQVSDVSVDPNGEASTGSPIKPKLMQGCEKGPPDEEPVVASLIKPKQKRRWEKDVTGALKMH